MKKILFLAIAIFAFQIVSAQETTTDSDNQIYNTAGLNKKPEFPEGIMAFYKFVGTNFKAPTTALKGKVYVTFIIEKDGSISNVKVLRDIGYGTGAEAIRVISISPKWIPGEKNGKKVRALYSMPISIMSES